MGAISINAGLERILPEDKVDSLSPAAAHALAYYAKLNELRAKNENVVVVHNVDDLPRLMERYFWSREQVIDALHSSIDWWNKHISPEVPYIFINKFIRHKFAENLGKRRTADRRTQNAMKIYAPSDVADVIRRKVTSTVVSVLVPIPFLTVERTEMRRIFNCLLKERLPDINNLNYRAHPPLHEWVEIRRMIAPKYQEHFGRWYDDVEELAKRQGRQTNRVSLPAYEVKLPGGMMPVFRRSVEVAENRDYITRGMGEMTVKQQGWVRNAFEGSNRTLFTPGIAVGGADFACDYQTGLLDLWTAERFVEVFGEENLRKWPMRFGVKDVAWQEARTFTTDYTLPAYLARLMGKRFLPNNR